MRAALAYAERGWPVFPLQNRGKLPITRDGYLSATADPAQIREWWSRYPGANIGIATGKPSGIWVLDIDQHGENGDASLSDLERQNGQLPDTLSQETPTGGSHRIFYLNGTDIRNRARIAPGLDVRGTGGYIVAPPSIHPNGKPYRWRNIESAVPMPAPGWLVDIVIGRKETPSSPSNDRAAPPEKYAAAAFGSILAELARAHEGERNEALNRAAFALGQFVGANALSEGSCRIALSSTARAIGLTDKEAEATIRSGIGAGMAEPRDLPSERRAYSKLAPPARIDPGTGEILSETLQQTEKPALAFQWFSDITPSLEVMDFVEGFLGYSALSVIFGEPGCGKTFLCLDMALHVALGRQWHGREVDQGGVVYVALEGMHGLRNRIAALRHHYGLDDAQVPMAVITSAVNLLDPLADTQRLIEMIASAVQTLEGRVILVIIDTLSRAISGGDENAPEDMGALVMNAQSIIAATGAHLTFVHHCGKDKSKGSRGHSNLLGNIDTEIEVVKDEAAKISTVKSKKQRDLEMFDDFSFQLKSVQLGMNRRGKPVTSCIVLPADAPDSNDPADSLKETEYAVFHEITELLSRAGIPNITPEEGMRPLVAVGKDHIRKWFVQRGLLSTDAKGAIDSRSRARFNRALESLIAKQLIKAHGDWVWIP